MITLPADVLIFGTACVFALGVAAGWRLRRPAIPPPPVEDARLTRLRTHTAFWTENLGTEPCAAAKAMLADMQAAVGRR